MTLILLTLGAAGQCLLGVALAQMLLCRPTESAADPTAERDFTSPCAEPRRAEIVGLGLLLGIGGCAWLSLLFSLAGGELGSTWTWSLTGFGWLAGCGAWMIGRRTRLPDRLESIEQSSLAKCLKVGVAGVLVLAVVQTLLTPQRFWDERAIFAIKAKVLHEDRSVESPTLRHPDFVQGHPRYPLLIPLAEQHVYAWLGRVDDRWSKIVFPVLFAGLVLSFAGVLARHYGPAQGWLYAGLLGTLPVLFPYELGFVSGQADAPVAAYHGAAVLYIWHALRTQRLQAAATTGRSPWIIAGCLAAGAVFTKDEGIAHLMIAAPAVALAWAAGRRGGATREFSLPRFLGSAGALFGVAAALLAPWFWHRRTLPTTTEMGYFERFSFDVLLKNGDALGWLVPHLLSRMFLEWSQWGLHWWIALAALISAPYRALRPEQLFLLLEMLGALSALVIAGMIAPAELHDHIGGSSNRYLMQIAPVVVLFIAGQWGHVRHVAATSTAGETEH